MIFGYSGSRNERLSLYDTPCREDKGVRWGEVVSIVFREAIDRQARMDALQRKLTSYIKMGAHKTTDVQLERNYARALNEKINFPGTFGTEYSRARRLIDTGIELRVTPVEGTDVIGEGILGDADFKKGTLSLEQEGSATQIINFAKISHKGRGVEREYVGNTPTADLELMNPDEVYSTVYPLVQSYRL